MLFVLSGQQATLNAFFLRPLPCGHKEMKGFVLRGSYGLALSIDIKSVSGKSQVNVSQCQRRNPFLGMSVLG